MLRLSVIAAAAARLGGARRFGTVSAAAVKELRQLTGAPMMDCRNALAEPDVEGDMDKAMEWLRMKGHSSAAKKKDREANEGLIGVCIGAGHTSAAIVHVRSETDFVARNQIFQQLVADLSKTALSQSVSGEVDANAFLEHELCAKDQLVSDAVTDVAAKVRENVVLHRVARLSVASGAVGSYTHNSVSAGLGTAAAIVGLETKSESNPELLQAISHKLAMHIVAAKPLYLSQADVPTDVVDKEKSLLLEELKDSGRPENIMEKIVQGRLSKFYSNVCLLDQPHLIEEGNPKVQKFLDQSVGELGAPIKLTDFRLYSI